MWFLFGGAQISNFGFEFSPLEGVPDGVDGKRRFLWRRHSLTLCYPFLLVLPKFFILIYSLDPWTIQSGEGSFRNGCGWERNFICELPLRSSGEGFKFQT